MLHKLWKKLTGWHAYQMEEGDSYRAIFFTKPEEDGYHDHPHVQIQIPYKPRWKVGAQLVLNGEDDLSGFVACGYQFFFTVQSLMAWPTKVKLAKWMDKHIKHGSGQRSFHATLHADEDSGGIYLWVDLWRDDSAWHHDDRQKAPWKGRGWHFFVDLKELALGDNKIRYSTDPEDTKFSLQWVSMPEGHYPVICKLTKANVQPGRLYALGQRYPLFAQPMQYHVSIKSLVPIPSPGKGENSWDQEDNGLSEMSFGFTPVRPWIPGYMQKVADSVMRDRRKYGNGYGWIPDEGWSPYVVPHGQPLAVHPDLVERIQALGLKEEE